MLDIIRDGQIIVLVIPILMIRPALAGVALRFLPHFAAHRADAVRIEHVPVMAAGTHPLLIRLRSPIAFRARNIHNDNLRVAFLITDHNKKEGYGVG